jgi:hypothetical protein
MSTHTDRRRGTIGLVVALAAFAAFLLVPVAQAAAAPSLKINLTGTGTGEVTSTSEEFFFFETDPAVECSNIVGQVKSVCTVEPQLFAENEEEIYYAADLVAHPASGNEVKWTIQKGAPFNAGAGDQCPTPDGTECQIKSATEGEEELEVTAEFVPTSGPPSFPLTLTTSGTGSGSFECAVLPGGSAGPCEAEYEEGKEAEILAHAAAGSHFVEWQGACTGTGPCIVTITAAKSVTGVFSLDAPPPNVPLIVEVVGDGEVTGTAISCTEGATAAECEEEVAEGSKASLTATASAGSQFAGWTTIEGASGTCTGTAATCEAGPLTGPAKLTATFAPNGTGGKSVVIGTATPQECPAGGITVEVEGEPSTKKAVCNGTNGTNGSPGSAGPVGNPGFPGATGAQGLAGPQGSAGAKGDTGAQGQVGATGPQGPAGPEGTVTCKISQQKGGSKANVTCTVKYKSAKTSSPSARWQLSHGGHVVRRGTARGGRLDLGQLRGGRYRLRIRGHKGSTLIEVS